MSDRIVIVGAKNIGLQIGESRNSIPRLVKEEGLPAWQKGKVYRVHSDELEAWSLEWAKRQRERNVQ